MGRVARLAAMTRHHSAAILPLLVLTALAAACNPVANPAVSPPSAAPTPAVTPSGTLPASPLASPVPSGVPSPGASPGFLDVTLVSGPHCPVETTPPDPACTPRPVANATVIVRDAAAGEIARATSDATGHAMLSVPGGTYSVEAQPVAGLMGTPAPEQVTVLATGAGALTLIYDTGIR